MKKTIVIKIDPKIHNQVKQLVRERKLKANGIRNVSEFYEASAKLLLRILEKS
ncbi:MAG: hypothetical protein J7K82_04420 [Thermoproteales archaeon]|nr:hypothetical protein [Thermoproteales archaeon]